MKNPCQNCEENILLSDIKSVEKVLGYTFPDAFVSHYLSFNGGVPTRAWWSCGDDFEPLEVAAFKPFKYNKLNNNNPSTLIDGCYSEMVSKNVIPSNIIPFGNDWGGNFFCLNKDDNSVVFYATDSFDPDVSMSENHRKLQKKLSSSFEDFIDGLVLEDDLE